MRDTLYDLLTLPLVVVVIACYEVKQKNARKLSSQSPPSNILSKSLTSKGKNWLNYSQFQSNDVKKYQISNTYAHDF